MGKVSPGSIRKCKNNLVTGAEQRSESGNEKECFIWALVGAGGGQKLHKAFLAQGVSGDEIETMGTRNSMEIISNVQYKSY